MYHFFCMVSHFEKTDKSLILTSCKLCIVLDLYEQKLHLSSDNFMYRNWILNFISVHSFVSEMKHTSGWCGIQVINEPKFHLIERFYFIAESGLGRDWYAHQDMNPALLLETQNCCWRSAWCQWTLWWQALRKSCRFLTHNSNQHLLVKHGQAHSLCWTQSPSTRSLFTGEEILD